MYKRQIYYSVKPNERGYRQRLNHKRKQTGKHQSINEQNLSDKVRYLIKQNYFSSFELNSLKLQPENMQINIKVTNTENHNEFADVISDTKYHIESEGNVNCSCLYYNESLKMQCPTPITEAMFKILEYVKNNDVKHLNINLKKQKNNPNLYHHLKHFNEKLE